MQVEGLGHVNIRTPAFEETVTFYESLMGLRAAPGASASKRSLNVWLHDPLGRAIIHVNGVAPGETVSPAEAPGRLDHFALDCSGLAACTARLEANGVPFDRMHLPSRSLTQIVLYDPNGIKVELTFNDRAEDPSHLGL